MPKYRMPMASLISVMNPLDCKTWQVEPITPSEVREAIDRKEFAEVSWQTALEKGIDREIHRIFHVRRIAYLAANPPSEDGGHKMHLAVSKDKTWFYDGNHRAAAAIVRGDPTIELWIASSGELDLPTLFPGLEEIEPQDDADR
ncbi:hypothetical protein FY136_28715 (plasmid) [Agrobacterium tumefaciens]|uniref:hypothetical protein n=1 Tax=Agrobacterium tumefaciens TaxID=358 RepID=UPI0021CDFCE6|nr:hypothetical protein [Agrobacterium tumefaciens]UXT53246.1 hypothetical protein FY136_28715 [Agrobacterium tumefaciens]